MLAAFIYMSQLFTLRDFFFSLMVEFSRKINCVVMRIRGKNYLTLLMQGYFFKYVDIPSHKIVHPALQLILNLPVCLLNTVIKTRSLLQVKGER